MHLTAPQILQERFEYKASVCCYHLQSTIIGVCHNKVCWSNPLHTDSCRKLKLVLLRAWHTTAVKEKSGMLQLKYDSLSRF